MNKTKKSTISGAVLVFALLGPPVVQEAQKLAQQVPEWSNQITPEQIAQRLGTSGVAIQSLLARARAAFREVCVSLDPELRFTDEGER